MDQNLSDRRGPKLFIERRKHTNPLRREKLPWPPGSVFRILSLDGGGIRGLYGATLLKLIEENITGGQPIAHFFDMIAGTSTGGIMALGLGLELPAARIESLYREDGRKIFSQPWVWTHLPILKTLRHFFRPLYQHAVLESLLYREFQDKKLGDSVTRLIIPAFMSPKTEIAVFKTDHHPDYQNDYRSKAWEVARATSAAPTYLSGHTSDDVMFLDGGIWANNPIMVAIVDVLSAYDLTCEQLQILSIGTGNFPLEPTLKRCGAGLIGWRDVIKSAMFLTTDNAHAQAALLMGPNRITRLEPTPEAKGIELDDWESSVKMLPSMAHSHFNARIDDLTQFFSDKAAKRDKFCS